MLIAINNILIFKIVIKIASELVKSYRCRNNNDRAHAHDLDNSLYLKHNIIDEKLGLQDTNYFGSLSQVSSSSRITYLWLL